MYTYAVHESEKSGFRDRYGNRCTCFYYRENSIPWSFYLC
ncbi:hypothetical protein GCWU000341_02111 [Oribacterium sp. oral taxon 078 str. F0262]|nr:hypothetical protein GCWU000341_02111 [Oribacterium sp. oral taxon 078 str. F0262]